MNCCNPTKETVLLYGCSNYIQLPIRATETGVWTLIIEFDNQLFRKAIDVANNEFIVVQRDVFNENFVHRLWIYKTNGTLFNDGNCYHITTEFVLGSPQSGEILPPDPEPYKETFILPRVTLDQTGTFQSDELIGQGVEIVFAILEVNPLNVEDDPDGQFTKDISLDVVTGQVQVLAPFQSGQYLYINYKKPR